MNGENKSTDITRILECWCGYRCMRLSGNLNCPYGHGDMKVVAE